MSCRTVPYDDNLGEKPGYYWSVSSSPDGGAPYGLGAGDLWVIVDADLQPHDGGDPLMRGYPNLRVGFVDDQDDLFSGGESVEWSSNDPFRAHAVFADDGSAVAFSGVMVVTPEFAYDRYESISTVSVSGYIRCPESPQPL